MAVAPRRAQNGTMTTPSLRRHAALTLAPRALRAAGVLAVVLSGGSVAVPLSTDDLIPDTVDAGDTGGDASGDNDGQVTVVGADLTSFTAALLAETYAEGRDPMPSVEFLDATTVQFTWADPLTEEQAIGNCQIAWGVMDGEGIRALFAAGGAESDCTALIEG